MFAKFCVAFIFFVGLVSYSVADETEVASEPISSGKFMTREHSGAEDRDKLLTDIFQGYKKFNYPTNATIKFGLSILSVDFDAEHDLMITNTWLRMVWKDERLAWNVSDYGGINVMRVPPEHVWMPDMTLYNSVHPTMECLQTNVLIYPSGEVLWVPPCRLESYCNVTLATKGPYEEQICNLKFGSWTFDGYTMGLAFYDNKPFVDMSDFMGRKYAITNTTAIREEKFYDCCKEPYINLLFTIGVKRYQPTNPSCGLNVKENVVE